MRAAIFHELRRIEACERPEPSLREPTDGIVRVVIGCVRGSALWYYRGDSEFEFGPIGLSSSASSRTSADAMMRSLLALSSNDEPRRNGEPLGPTRLAFAGVAPTVVCPCPTDLRRQHVRSRSDIRKRSRQRRRCDQHGSR